MYAIIELQGTQVKVEKDSKILVNKIKDQKDKNIKIEKVLFGKKGSSYLVGEPYVEGAYVEGEILADKKGKKVIAYKYRDRKSSQSKKGHRQQLTEIKINKIHLA